MKTIAKISILFLVTFSLQGCFYDKEEELFPELNPACDTSNVMYQTTVSSIMSSFCVSCHGSTPSANLDLRTYDAVKSNIDAVYGSMNHDAAYSPMPKNSNKLSDCKIRSIKIWKDLQFPN
jgi:hypothetical protein